MIVDAGCEKLVRDPTKFDVLLMENLYGDMVTALAAGEKTRDLGGTLSTGAFADAVIARLQ